MNRGAEFFVGRTLPGKIQLTEPIGSGGNGIAFKAIELARKTPQEPVVVKLFNRDANASEVAKFLAEAFHMSRLHHPHIVPIRRIGVEEVKLREEGGRETVEYYPFFVMKYANMGDVRRLKPVGSFEPVPVEQVLAIASDIAEALQFAHDAEDPLLHLDVKPENMLRHKDPMKDHIDVLLADFGFAAVAHTINSLETPQGVGGTPPYMAPEQFRGKAVRETDQYALAVFVYEFLTGRLPFGGKGIKRSDPIDVLLFKWYEIHQNEMPPTFEDALKATGKGDLLKDRQLAAVLRELQDVVFTALAKNPEDRYNTVTTFTKTLKKTATVAAQETITGKPFPGVDVPHKKDVSQLTTEITSDVLKAQALVERCKELYELEKYPEVSQVVEQAIALDPNNAEAWLLKGLSMCTYDKYEEAIPAYDQVIQLDPKDRIVYCDAMWNKANCLVKLGRYEKALPLLEEVLQLNSMFALAWEDKGQALDALGRHQEALIAHDQAIKINPSNSIAFTNKGITLDALGRHQEALIAHDQAIKIDPSNSFAFTNKGIALHALGRHQEALAAYDQAIKINPGQSEAYMNKGVALSVLGRHQEALAAYDQAISLNPGFSDAYMNKGIALDALGRHQEALAAYDQAISLNPRNSYAYYSKGFALNALGRHQEALIAHDQAISLNPGFSDAFYDKGIALERLGRKKEARQAFEIVLELDPYNKYAKRKVDRLK